jgi:protein-S-isoprenylcysteine O-methyltransferase Ste14
MPFVQVSFLATIWIAYLASLKTPRTVSVGVRTHERVKNTDMSLLLQPINMLAKIAVPLQKVIAHDITFATACLRRHKYLVSAVMAAEILACLAYIPSTPFFTNFLHVLPGTLVTRPHLSYVMLFGGALTVLGAYIRFACIRTLGAHFTYELVVRDNHQLVRAGPYALVRHPAYVGTMLTSAGITLVELAQGSWWTEACVGDTVVGKVVTVIWIAMTALKVTLLARAPKEDAMLRGHFGKEWDAYAKEVRWWYIPGLI